MTITYQFERWDDIAQEVEHIMSRRHAPEASVFQDKMRVQLDHVWHAQQDAAGRLENLTVRDDGKLIGYHISLKEVNPHFAGVSLMAWVLHYFLDPTYRSQGIGSAMFRTAEKSLQAHGVKCVHSEAKNHLPFATLFTHLGWTPTGTLFMKWLGE